VTIDSFDFSPYAERVTEGVRDPDLGVERTAWGFCVHTTGGGITSKAKRDGVAPIEYALRYYKASQNGANKYMWGGPAYVADFDGSLYQIAPDNVKTAHCGGRSEKYPDGTRGFYIDGSWVMKLTPAVVKLWREHWPGKKHPYVLFPARDPNTDYVGLEVIPIGDGFGGAPMRPGLRFTKAQHDAVIRLGVDLGLRHEWPTEWWRTGRLVGHEDVDPLNRSDTHGGWDPGWNRPDPYFDFGYVRSGIAGAM